MGISVSKVPEIPGVNDDPNEPQTSESSNLEKVFSLIRGPSAEETFSAESPTNPIPKEEKKLSKPPPQIAIPTNLFTPCLPLDSSYREVTHGSNPHFTNQFTNHFVRSDIFLPLSTLLSSHEKEKGVQTLTLDTVAASIRARWSVDSNKHLSFSAQEPANSDPSAPPNWAPANSALSSTLSPKHTSASPNVSRHNWVADNSTVIPTYTSGSPPCSASSQHPPAPLGAKGPPLVITALQGVNSALTSSGTGMENIGSNIGLVRDRTFVKSDSIFKTTRETEDPVMSNIRIRRRIHGGLLSPKKLVVGEVYQPLLQAPAGKYMASHYIPPGGEGRT
eukprot:CAMPEP_0198206112 /NCGR_PEP_ID=MMETSP1445-20131203/9630_1 /TAXON_ID=36898 /ORGANISM="Pyramimonas sp., Strain CCMP2087" /LENGTH=333 /DNA_ID=CAMNT_0043878663 /DNA_START=188 /DNA_END=1185 /DNA_ORIENTATION=+